MQKTKTEVHEQLDRHHARLTTSREVLTKRLSRLWGQPRGREQHQAQGIELRQSKKGTQRHKDTGITQANNTAMDQKVGESTSGTHITTGD